MARDQYDDEHDDEEFEDEYEGMGKRRGAATFGSIGISLIVHAVVLVF